MQRHHLQKLSREELIREAERAGVPRPRVLTQAELLDEILKRTATSDRDRGRGRGWLGRARDLIATVVEKGLHLPDAAAVIRQGPKGWPPPPPPLPTVTLAEIYAAQGHLERAVAVLEDVLGREPDHAEARELRERFLAQLARGPKGASEPPARAEAEPEDEAGAGDEANEAGPAAFSQEEAAAAMTPLPATLPASPEAPRSSEEPAAVSGESADTTLPSTIDPEPVASVALVTARSPSARTFPSPAGADLARSEEPRSNEPIAASEAAAASEEIPGEQAIAPSESAVNDAAAEAVAAPVAEAAPPVAETAAAALPERYDVDEIVALAVDPSTFYVYWEVRPTTFAHMAAETPGGSLALRVVAVTPGWDGPIIETRDTLIDALFGDQFIRHVRPRADVRVSIGWLKEGRFDPIAVGAEVSAPRAFVAAGSPGPAGAPQDLSEGPHGVRGSFDAGDAAGFGRGGFAARVRRRGGEMLAAGWVPRDLQGALLEGGPAQGAAAAAGGAGWVWVQAGVAGSGGEADGGLHVTYGPAAGPGGGLGGASELTARPWGGASELGRWGGASDQTAWGGES